MNVLTEKIGKLLLWKKKEILTRTQSPETTEELMY